VVVQSERDVYEKDQPVKLKLAATAAGDYVITLDKHQTEIASLKVSLLAGQQQEISLTPPASADGVLIATVTDKARGIPVAERLIFRQSEKGLHVSVKADKSTYVPADSATLTITTTDDDGKPIGAMVGITVTDQSILQMIEKRERAPRLGAMVMLESDVRELADADVYLDPADPRGPLATDLLLGTQGWRRFASVDVAKFIAAQGDAGRRAMADLQPVAQDGSGAWGGFGGGGGAWAARDGMFLGRAAEAKAMATAEPVSDGPAPLQVVDQLKKQADAQKLEVPGDGNDSILLPTDDDIPPVVAAMPPMDQQRMLRPMMQPVRIYAHDLAPGHQPGERNDFTETLYWCAGVKTDPTTGIGTVTFKLNDSVTSFMAMADGFTNDGRIGSGQTTISSAEPF
jgi:hypothetical protein